MALAGGYTSFHSVTPNDEAYHLAMVVKQAVEHREKLTFHSYVPVEYATQVVNGINYKIVVVTEHGNYELIVWKQFGPEGRVELTNVTQLYTQNKNAVVTHLGGYGPLRPVKDGDEAYKIALEVRAEVEQRAHRKFAYYIPFEFSTQVVAGTNYKIIIKADTYLNVEAFIFKPLGEGSKPQVTDVHVLYLLADNATHSSSTLPANGGITGGIFPGGYTPFQPVHVGDEVYKLSLSVKQQVENKAHRDFPDYEPVKFATQLVNGINYKVIFKSHNSTWQFIVYRSFGGSEAPVVTSVQQLLTDPTAAGAGTIPGGWSTPQPAFGTEAASIAEKVRPDVEKKMGIHFLGYTPSAYATKVVGDGVQYKIIIHVSTVNFLEDQLEIIVLKHENGTLELLDAHFLVPQQPTSNRSAAVIGGFSSFQTVHKGDEAFKITAKIKPEVEKRVNKEFKNFVALEYAVQIVNGKNYKIVVAADNEKLLVKVYVRLGHKVAPELESVQPYLTPRA